MYKILITVLLCAITSFLAPIVVAQNHVSNIRVQQLEAMVIVKYDLAEKADIEVFVSFDNGTNYRGPLQHVTGAVGKGILPEKDKMVMWDVLKELGEVDYSNVVIKIVAENPTLKATSSDLLFSPFPGTMHVFNSDFDHEQHKQYRGKDRRQYFSQYHKQHLLKKDEVRQIMAGTDALHLYNKGIRKTNNGLIWSSLGLGGCIVSFIGIANEDPELYWGGMAFSFMSIVFTFSKTSQASKLIKQSVNMYNNDLNQKTTGVEMQFGIVGNGVGVAFRF